MLTFLFWLWVTYQETPFTKNQKHNAVYYAATTIVIRAVAGQRSSPESGFANETKMFFRAKNIRREITGP